MGRDDIYLKTFYISANLNDDIGSVDEDMLKQKIKENSQKIDEYINQLRKSFNV